jgi:hypothetical protein
MTRPAFAALAAVLSAAMASTAFAQAQPAAPSVQPAPARAKWVAPIKGIASIQIIPGTSKKVGNDIVTTMKIKNVSNGAIALLRVDEYWFDKSNPPKVVSGDTQRWPKPFNPGDVIEMTTKSPFKPNLGTNTFNFTHANGKIDVKKVKKFTS